MENNITINRNGEPGCTYPKESHDEKRSNETPIQDINSSNESKVVQNQENLESQSIDEAEDPNIRLSRMQLTQNENKGPENLILTKAELEQYFLGSPIPENKKIQRFFYDHDIFSSDQFIRTYNGFNNCNIALNIIFKLSILAYWIYMTYMFFTYAPSTQYSLMPTYDMSPVLLKLSLTCSQQWGCYNWTDNSTPTWKDPTTFSRWIPINVVGTYSNVDKSYCGEKNFIIPIRSAYAFENVSFVVCYSTTQSAGIYLEVPFSGSEYNKNVYLRVIIQGDDSRYDNKLRWEMDIYPSEQKAVFLSQIQKTIQGSSSKPIYEPYIGDQFYTGHSPTNSALLQFKMQQFGYNALTIPPPSYWSILGVVGGFHDFLLPYFCFMKPNIDSLIAFIARRKLHAY